MPPGPEEEPDWRRPETYAHTEALTRVDWAWEFLRRNPAFRADLQACGKPATSKEVSQRCELKRWGVYFRRLSDTLCSRCKGILGSGAVSLCLASDPQPPIVRDAADTRSGSLDSDGGLRRKPPRPLL